MRWGSRRALPKKKEAGRVVAEELPEKPLLASVVRFRGVSEALKRLAAWWVWQRMLQALRVHAWAQQVPAERQATV